MRAKSAKEGEEESTVLWRPSLLDLISWRFPTSQERWEAAWPSCPGTWSECEAEGSLEGRHVPTSYPREGRGYQLPTLEDLSLEIQNWATLHFTKLQTGRCCQKKGQTGLLKNWGKPRLSHCRERLGFVCVIPSGPSSMMLRQLWLALL